MAKKKSQTPDPEFQKSYEEFLDRASNFLDFGGDIDDAIAFLQTVKREGLYQPVFISIECRLNHRSLVIAHAQQSGLDLADEAPSWRHLDGFVSPAQPRKRTTRKKKQ